MYDDRPVQQNLQIYRNLEIERINNSNVPDKYYFPGNVIEPRNLIIPTGKLNKFNRFIDLNKKTLDDMNVGFIKENFVNKTADEIMAEKAKIEERKKNKQNAAVKKAKKLVLEAVNVFSRPGATASEFREAKEKIIHGRQIKFKGDSNYLWAIKNN